MPEENKQPEQPRKPRKTRSDKGIILATDRDQLALTWIAEQYAARLDQVQRLLSRWPGAPTKSEKGIAATTAKDQVDRWRRAGWVEYRRVLADGPGWIWLTRKGLQMVDLDDYLARPPAFIRLNHIYAINQLRLWMDIQMNEEGDFTWTSEREYRTTLEQGKRGKSTGPIPDAIIENKKIGKVAVEVELSVKKPKKLVKKLEELVDAEDVSVYRYIPRFPSIWVYTPNNKTKGAVERAIGKLVENDQERISVAIDKALVG